MRDDPITKAIPHATVEQCEISYFMVHAHRRFRSDITK
jgi:hypothetical protein